MLDKIKANAGGMLPAEYVPNLGRGFDARCTAFLRVNYAELVELVAQGERDEAILQWCFANGRRPQDDEIHI